MDIDTRISILKDLSLNILDEISFASYRTACKLRYIQKSTNRNNKEKY